MMCHALPYGATNLLGFSRPERHNPIQFLFLIPQTRVLVEGSGGRYGPSPSPLIIYQKPTDLKGFSGDLDLNLFP
jgi:hypothetical protein